MLCVFCGATIAPPQRGARVINLKTLDDLANLRESVEVECKLAAGADGKGRLPREFWPTYSAFANTRGGIIVLGLREDAGHFSLHGIEDVDRIVNDLFNTANNPEKVSVNLLDDNHVRRLSIEGKELIAVEVPAADRKQKPVYVNNNPLYTYRRLYNGDRRCDQERIGRLYGDREDSRDHRVVLRSSIADLDPESLEAYRNTIRGYKPDHPWANGDCLTLLRALGAWDQDPETREEGLTLAGILMLGQWHVIHRHFPYFFLDYQERPTEEEQMRDDLRWVDRVIHDGTWSGNIFDFYRRVVRRLYADVKVPFVLKNNVRQDDTPVHKALREAMVNALIHADYRDRASVEILKQPSGFVFRHPGVLRVPAAKALRGGLSDCRNPSLQKMFLMIGLGEKAGSGMAKIQQGWQHTGGTIRLEDSVEPFDYTLLKLDFPPTTGDTLEKTLGITPEKKLEKTPEKILLLLKSHPDMSVAEIATHLNKSNSAIDRAIRKLKSEGRLKRIGSDKGGHWEVQDP